MSNCLGFWKLDNMSLRFYHTLGGKKSSGLCFIFMVVVMVIYTGRWIITNLKELKSYKKLGWFSFQTHHFINYSNYYTNFNLWHFKSENYCASMMKYLSWRGNLIIVGHLLGLTSLDIKICRALAHHKIVKVQVQCSPGTLLLVGHFGKNYRFSWKSHNSNSILWAEPVRSKPNSMILITC